MKPFLVLAFLLTAASAVCAQSIDAPAARIAHFDGDRAAALSYTFDDNLRDQYTLAVPMLKEVGFKGTFFVIPGATAETVAEAEEKLTNNLAWGSITWTELKEMAAQGHEIASHSWSHPNLQKLPPEELESQLSKACDEIKKRLGSPALRLAFPFNAATPEVRAAALKYHVAFRGYQLGVGAKTTAESLDAWADKQVKEKKWGVAMFHAIAKGYAALDDPGVLRIHWKHVKDREREIWVDTFANIARYERERDDAKLSCTGKTGSLRCTLTSSLDPQVYDVPLTLVIEAKGATSARAERAGRELPVRIQNDTIHVQATPGMDAIVVTWK